MAAIKGLSEAKIAKIREASAKLVAASLFCTGFEVMERRKVVAKLTTGSKSLDELLGESVLHPRTHKLVGWGGRKIWPCLARSAGGRGNPQNFDESPTAKVEFLGKNSPKNQLAPTPPSAKRCVGGGRVEISARPNPIESTVGSHLFLVSLTDAGACVVSVEVYSFDFSLSLSLRYCRLVYALHWFCSWLELSHCLT